MLKKIISGGQTGADEAGLEAGRVLGLETGGWMPKGFITKAGPRPDFAVKYGVTEHPSPTYPPRTRNNVMDGCGTLIMGTLSDRGSILTRRFCVQYVKPRLEILWRPNQHSALVTADRIIDFIRTNDIEVLNVAGNSEESNSGIYDMVLAYLVRSLQPLVG